MLKNKFFWFATGLVLVAIALDFSFNVAEVHKTTELVKDLNGNTKPYDIFTFSQKYKFLKLLSELLYTLGISIAIYFGIEYKMDQIEKKKDRSELNDLQEKINLNIFNGVLKKLIPEQLFDIIVRDILNKPILRKNARWTYEITETEKGYTLTQIIEYELQNIGNQSYPVPIKIDVHHTSHSKSYFQYFKIVKEDKIFIELDDKKIAERQIETEKGISNVVDVEIKAKEVIHVTHTVVNEYFSKCVVDCHFSNYSIIGLTISVDKPTDCDFHLVSTFTEKLKASNPTPKKIFYSPIQGILIGQSVIFMIEKKMP